LEKRREAAVEEANLAFQEYEDSLKKLENSGGLEDPKAASSSGRRVFGPAKAQTSHTSVKVKSDNSYGGSDSEDDLGFGKSGNLENMGSHHLHNKDSVVIQEDTDTHKESLVKVMVILFCLFSYIDVFLNGCDTFNAFFVHRPLMILLKILVQKLHTKFPYLCQISGKRFKCS